ncbi:hypothetical protein R6Q59_016483, partial [Mikania micrantha]
GTKATRSMNMRNLDIKMELMNLLNCTCLLNVQSSSLEQLYLVEHNKFGFVVFNNHINEETEPGDIVRSSQRLRMKFV